MLSGSAWRRLGRHAVIGSARQACTLTRAVCGGVTGSGELGDASVLLKDSDTPQQYDVAIVGAGVVGLSLAVRLAKSPKMAGRSLAVIEAMPPRHVSSPAELASIEDVDLRVFAIAQKSAQAFQDMGVWDDIVGARVTPFSSMQVWDTTGDGYVRFDASLVQAAQLGYIIENRVMHNALYNQLLALQEEGRVDLLCPNKVKDVDVRSIDGSGGGAYNHCDVNLEQGRLQCELLVAADGGNSAIRSLCNVGTWGWDYDQRGMVCAIETSEPNTTAWQRFLPSGPVAILPLWGKLSSIVWSTSPAEAQRLTSLSEGQFIKELNAVFAAAPEAADVPPFVRPLRDAVRGATRALTSSPGAPMFKGAPQVVGVAGPRASFPLRFSHTNKYHTPRVAFIGDAAHTVHPLAGQGMNLGIADAMYLADLLEAGASVGQDLGASDLLSKYGERRKAHNLAMMLGLDALKSTFAAEDGLFADARSLGMSALNATPAFKKQMVRFAMGHTPQLPWMR